MTTTSEDKMKTFNDALIAEIKEVDETLLPLLREYLNNVRDIRMALAREVKEILQSSTELGRVTKTAPEIKDFIEKVLILDKVMTPELLEKISKLVK